MTDTPGYGSSSNHRRVLFGVALLVLAVLAGGVYGLWALGTDSDRAEFSTGEALNASIADAPTDLSETDGETAFVVRHTGGSAVDYRSLRVVVYRDGTPLRTLDNPQWRDVSLVARENGSAPSAFGTFAPGDALRIAEPPSENSALESGREYLVVLVGTDSGQRLAAARVTLR